MDTMDMLRRDGEERWTEEAGRRGGWVAAGAPPAASQGEEAGRRGTKRGREKRHGGGDRNIREWTFRI